jgi:phenylacetate-CoA oxygenase PaaJ subunit
MPVMDKTVTEAIWELLRTVPDPEIPVISICDLGIVRAVNANGEAGTEIVITPTYSGCPAMQVIEDDIREKLAVAGFDNVSVKTVLVKRSRARQTAKLWHRATRAAIRRYRGRALRHPAPPCAELPAMRFSGNRTLV